MRGGKRLLLRNVMVTFCLCNSDWLAWLPLSWKTVLVVGGTNRVGGSGEVGVGRCYWGWVRLLSMGKWDECGKGMGW